MARMKFVQYWKAMSIVLLLFAATPPVLAQGLAAAQDILMEQLQTRTKEAEARAAEAEKREREAEINRLTDQAQQAQSHADAEAQRSLAVQRELFIQQAKTELHNSAYSRLEILIGVFGILLTGIIIFFSLSTKETAVAAAKAGVEDIRGKLEARLVEAEALVAKLRDHEKKGEEIIRKYSPGEVPKSEADRKTIADAARDARLKPPRDRTANEFRAIVLDHQAEKQWAAMIEAAQQMRLLYDGFDDFGFARFSEAYALEQQGRTEEALSIYGDIFPRFKDSSETPVQRQAIIILINRGVLLGRLGQHEKAIEAYDDVIRSYLARDEAELQEWVARALVNKSSEFAHLQQPKEAITTCDVVVERYGTSTALTLQESVGKALINKGVALGQLQRQVDAIAVYEDVIERYGKSNAAVLVELVVRAHVYKGMALGQLLRSQEAIAVYDDVITHHGQDTWAKTRELVRNSHYNKACAFAQMRQVTEAIAALQAMLKAGYPLNLNQIAKDTDFDSIRNDAVFKKFLDDNLDDNKAG